MTGTGTAGTAGTALHARTVALEYGPDALEFDGSPTVLFDRPGLTLVGWGTALLVPAGEAAGALAAIPCDDQVATLGRGPSPSARCRSATPSVAMSSCRASPWGPRATPTG